MLPKMSGFEICRKLREEGFSMPILLLTARGEEEDRVLGLDLGADDYVTKPFSIREVLARVRALLRRAYPSISLPEEVRFDDVVVDFMRYVAMKGGSRVEMTRKEFGVLRLLAAKVGQVVTRDDLLNEVWGMENFPVTRTVDNHIALLRAKLERNPVGTTAFYHDSSVSDTSSWFDANPLSATFKNDGADGSRRRRVHDKNGRLLSHGHRARRA
jgi:DNA-binding response OmpR family regulator